MWSRVDGINIEYFATVCSGLNEEYSGFCFICSVCSICANSKCMLFFKHALLASANVCMGPA